MQKRHFVKSVKIIPNAAPRVKSGCKINPCAPAALLDFAGGCGTITRSKKAPAGRSGGCRLEKKPSKFRELLNKYHEIVMYLIFGVATTVVSWIVYGVAIRAIISSGGFSPLWKLSAETVNIDVANIISWIISVTFAFITNKLWVFESKSWEHAVVWKEAWTFYGGRVFTGVLELVLMPLLVSWGLNMTLFKIEYFPAKIIVSVIVIILNYLLSKFISFKKKPEAAK
jgi:putative flippase GtrA